MLIKLKLQPFNRRMILPKTTVALTTFSETETRIICPSWLPMLKESTSCNRFHKLKL